MRDFSHDNLARFVGLCLDEPNYAFITELATRGSLSDMLENESVKIDWIFKYSIISDIVEGMTYLHSTPHQFHGKLKSTNCVVDSRFTVKIINFGMKKLEHQLNRSTMNDENFNPRSLFWTAPEHLRERDPTMTGSQKGDVYSFAIILQEIITRCAPFESMERAGRKKGHLNPEEILDRLKMGVIPAFRPEVAPDEAPPELLDLMHMCWAEEPNVRPDFNIIRPRLRKITKGVTSKNFLDNLLNRMEQYANNLEKIVEEKTESLIEEKLKTEEILYQLLPKFIAEELKKGSVVKPEAFEAVSVFFSDIEGFTSLSAESTPLQVVDLLNDLYTCFDAIIGNYDVYKVETIGDAYMCASGLPIRNGANHSREIARMALDLRDAMASFKIRHKPGRQLRVRIGLHTGPCVAGVVGLKMPKYCLFGDTVNTASRMESHGEPLKVHISASTKEVLEANFPNFKISLRGDIEIKGKGVMTTYWLDSEANRPPLTRGRTTGSSVEKQSSKDKNSIKDMASHVITNNTPNNKSSNKSKDKASSKANNSVNDNDVKKFTPPSKA